MTNKLVSMKPTELIERLDKVSGDLKDAAIPEDMDKLQKELERLGLKDEAKQLDEIKWAVWRSAEAFADMWEAVKVKCKLDEEKDDGPAPRCPIGKW